MGTVLLPQAAGLTVGRRSRWKAAGRDGTQHIALPHVVLESRAYRLLGYAARALLLDIAMQHKGHNNGKLVACAKYLRPLGWTSADTITRAKKALLDSNLLIETRKGWRPSRAAWYGLAWYPLQHKEGLEIEPATFERIRRAYRTSLTPIAGVATRTIAPKNGVAA